MEPRSYVHEPLDSAGCVVTQAYATRMYHSFAVREKSHILSFVYASRAGHLQSTTNYCLSAGNVHSEIHTFGQAHNGF